MRACRRETRKTTRALGLQRILRGKVVLQHPLKRRTREGSRAKTEMELVMASTQIANNTGRNLGERKNLTSALV
jgi:hypothetical protein